MQDLTPLLEHPGGRAPELLAQAPVVGGSLTRQLDPGAVALPGDAHIAGRFEPIEELGDRPRIGFELSAQIAPQHFANDVDAALVAAGFGDIRPAHANVFPFVPAEGIRVSELARLARVRKQTTAQAVEELERAGYVERRPDPRDRRARLVFLTPRGEAVRPVAVAAGRRVEERWAGLTSPEEIEALRGHGEEGILAIIAPASELLDADSSARSGSLGYHCAPSARVCDPRTRPGRPQTGGAP